ncbi:MAG: hypothetical protein MK212_02180 [Saprospiraceae bacterium]|nr:hypothetical protein [Saprospiraceae bacterium]
MKKHFFSFLFLTSILLTSFSSCKDKTEDTGSLKITFKAVYDTEPLVLYTQAYMDVANNSELTLQVLNFFISNLKIKDAEGNTTNLSTAEYIDFSNNHSQASTASLGESIVLTDINVGEYTSLDFGIGLDATTNATTPGDYSTSSPLSDVGNYWSAWDSYIFSRMEGRFQESCCSSPTSFLYHSGVGESYQARSFNKAISIAADTETELVIHLNVKKLIYPDNKSNQINITQNNVSHSGDVGTEEYQTALKSIINIADALYIE